MVTQEQLDQAILEFNAATRSQQLKGGFQLVDARRLDLARAQYKSSKRIRAQYRQNYYNAIKEQQMRVEAQKARESAARSQAEAFEGSAIAQSEALALAVGSSRKIDSRLPSASRISTTGRVESFFLPASLAAKQRFIEQGTNLSSTFSKQDIPTQLQNELTTRVKSKYENESAKIPTFISRHKEVLHVVPNPVYPSAPNIVFKTGGAEVMPDNTVIKTKSSYIYPDPLSGGSQIEVGLNSRRITKPNPYLEIIRAGGSVNISNASIEQPTYTQDPRFPDYVNVSYGGKKEKIKVEGFRHIDQIVNINGIDYIYPKNTIEDIKITPPKLDYTLPAIGGRMVSNVTLPKELSKDARYKISEIKGQPLGFSSPYIIGKTSGEDTLNFDPLEKIPIGVLREANIPKTLKKAGSLEIEATRQRMTNKSFFGQLGYTLKFAKADIVYGGSGVKPAEVGVLTLAGFAFGTGVGAVKLATNYYKIPKTVMIGGNVIKYGGVAAISYFGGKQILSEAQKIRESPFPKVEGLRFTGRQLANIGGFAVGSYTAGLAVQAVKTKLPSKGRITLYEESVINAKRQQVRVNTLTSKELVLQGTKYKDLQITIVSNTKNVYGFGRYMTAQGKIKTFDFFESSKAANFKSFTGNLFPKLGYREQLLTIRGKTSTNLIFKEGVFSQGSGKIIDYPNLNLRFTQIGKAKFAGERIAVSYFEGGQKGSIFTRSYVTAGSKKGSLTFLEGKTGILGRQVFSEKAPKINFLKGKIATGKFEYNAKILKAIQVLNKGNLIAARDVKIRFTRQPKEIQKTIITEFRAKAIFDISNIPKPTKEIISSIGKGGIIGKRGQTGFLTEIPQRFKTSTLLKPRSSSRLNNLQGVIPVGSLKVLTATKINPAILPLVTTGEVNKTVLSSKVTPELKPLSIIKPLSRPITIPKLGLKPALAQPVTSKVTGKSILRPQTVSTSLFTAGAKPIITPVNNPLTTDPIIPPPTIPFTSLFSMPDSLRKRRRSKKQEGFQLKQYSPTLTSFIFGIKGKFSRIGVKTGLGIRPIQI